MPVSKRFSQTGTLTTSRPRSAMSRARGDGSEEDAAGPSREAHSESVRFKRTPAQGRDATPGFDARNRSPNPAKRALALPAEPERCDTGSAKSGRAPSRRKRRRHFERRRQFPVRSRQLSHRFPTPPSHDVARRRLPPLPKLQFRPTAAVLGVARASPPMRIRPEGIGHESRKAFARAERVRVRRLFARRNPAQGGDARGEESAHAAAARIRAFDRRRRIDRPRRHVLLHRARRSPIELRRAAVDGGRRLHPRSGAGDDRRGGTLHRQLPDRHGLGEPADFRARGRQELGRRLGRQPRWGARSRVPAVDVPFPGPQRRQCRPRAAQTRRRQGFARLDDDLLQGDHVQHPGLPGRVARLCGTLGERQDRGHVAASRRLRRRRLRALHRQHDVPADGLADRANGPPAGGARRLRITLANIAHNIVWATLGNIVGGAGFVGAVYWLIYRKGLGGLTELR